MVQYLEILPIQIASRRTKALVHGFLHMKKARSHSFCTPIFPWFLITFFIFILFVDHCCIYVVTHYKIDYQLVIQEYQY